jgi:hypothetical protein
LQVHDDRPSLIHRDLKAINILIRIGKLLADLEPENDINVSERIQWPGMPWRERTPELVQRAIDHKTVITAASGIFQAGKVFYVLLTGVNP